MDNASQVLDKHFDNRVIKLPLVISGSRGWAGLGWAAVRGAHCVGLREKLSIMQFVFYYRI